MQVSIIIPVYNVAPYVERCIQSVINQTYKNLEVIIVDDCGTDNSMEIVEQTLYTNGFNIQNGNSLTSYHSPITFKVIHHERNKGLGESRNTGIDAAKGEYLLFVDSDDTISSECVSILLGRAIKTNADITIASYDQIISSTGERRKGVHYSNETIECEHAGVYAINNYHPMHIALWNKLFKLSFLNDNHLRTVHRIFEDVVIGFKINVYCRTISFVSDITLFYTVRDDSITGEVAKGDNIIARTYSDIPNRLRLIIRQDLMYVPNIWDCYTYYICLVCCELGKSEYTKEQRMMIYKNMRGMISDTPNILSYSKPIDRFLYIICLFSENYITYNYCRHVFWPSFKKYIKWFKNVFAT